jgi:Flp pilus assembly pilin Flp
MREIGQSGESSKEPHMPQLMFSPFATQMRLMFRSLAARLVRDERGQDAIEYVGVLVIVAAVIGVLLAVVNQIEPSLTTDVKNAITSIFNGGKKGGG